MCDVLEGVFCQYWKDVRDPYRSKWLKEFYDEILNAEASVAEAEEKEVVLQSSFEFSEPE